jgi:hypothetical protein
LQGPEYLFHVHTISEVGLDLACNHKPVGPYNECRRHRDKPTIISLILAERVAAPFHELCKALAKPNNEAERECVAVVRIAVLATWASRGRSIVMNARKYLLKY